MTPESEALSKLLRAADGTAGLLERIRHCAAGIPVTSRIRVESMRSDALTACALDGFMLEGYGQLDHVETPERCTAIRRTIDGVLDAGLPAVFAYVVDPLWTLGERIRAALSVLLDHRYRLIADVWAWRIDRGERGWPPHRGWAHAILDRRAPELVNVWVALSDVTADQSCVHVVPLTADTSYPRELQSTAGRLECVLALPVPSGAALFWNANTLHWGGPCTRRARGPRYSCSFSLVRADAVDLIGCPVVEIDALDEHARVDLVASQIVTYGEGKPDVTPEVLDWARATTALRGLADAAGVSL